MSAIKHFSLIPAVHHLTVLFLPYVLDSRFIPSLINAIIVVTVTCFHRPPSYAFNTQELTCVSGFGITSSVSSFIRKFYITKYEGLKLVVGTRACV